MKLFTAYAFDGLNEQASVLVDVQTDIKTAIKNGVLNGVPFFRIKNKVRELIEKALSKIMSISLKEDARKSLIEFSNRVYSALKSQFPNPIMATAIYTLVKAVSSRIERGELPASAGYYKPNNTPEKKAFKALYGETFNTEEKGIPLQEFQSKYIRRVSNALDNLAKQRALDPNDVTGRNSLRNLAEMQVRYERHQEEIKSLRESGVKLVICSVHGDCSKRCSEWQGRVFSLDGTFGKTNDGREYVPLELATDIFYTTKAGRTYKNGLLGFNCRHRLIPYKEGMVAPYVSTEEQAKQRYITTRQRQLERTVISWREEALAQKGNAVKHQYARKKALEWYERYKKFSEENGRAYYPDRVKIL